jgi:uncharacterized protein YbjQ (UPF0145 family)
VIVVTTDSVPGYRIRRVCGLAKGCSVRGVHLGDDMIAQLKNSIGGEVHEYTRVFAQTREQALDRLLEDARHLGANAVVGLRFTATEIASGVAELMVYGTAVVAEPIADV